MAIWIHEFACFCITEMREHVMMSIMCRIITHVLPVQGCTNQVLWVGNSVDSMFKIIGNQVPLVSISFVQRLNRHKRCQDGTPEGQWFHQSVVIQSIPCILPRSLWLVTQSRASVKIFISCQSDCITNHDFSSVPLTLIHTN